MTILWYFWGLVAWSDFPSVQCVLPASWVATGSCGGQGGDAGDALSRPLLATPVKLPSQLGVITFSKGNPKLTSGGVPTFQGF